MVLLKDVTTNLTTQAEACFGYLHSLFCYGVFDGACVRVQGSPDGVEWFDVASFTAKSILTLSLFLNHMRAQVCNAGERTCVTLIIE
jgi:hypothetical protein